MKFVLQLLIVLLVFNCAKIKAQGTNDEYKLNKSWSAGIGIADYSIDENISLYDFSEAYPSLNLPADDYSLWEKDKKLSTEDYALLPTVFMFEFAAPFTRSKSNWLRNTEWRPSVSFGYSSSYSEGIQKINGSTAFGNTFTRDFYYLSAYSSVLTLHNSIIHHTRHYGKEKRLRFSYGLGFSASSIWLDASLYHVFGTYVSKGHTSDYHSWSYYPAEALAHQWEEKGSFKTQLIGLGFDVPLSVEFLISKKKNIHLGYQVYFGESYITNALSQKISFFMFNSLLFLRFDINKSNKRK